MIYRFAFFVLAFAAQVFATIPWPMAPFNSAQPLGNSYGEYQYYGGSPYMHPGIDILRPAGTPVYAVKGGWVKAVLTTSAALHWRVAIADCNTADSCEGWLYAHLDQPTITVTVGEWVDSGQHIGDLVEWPVANFHHLHFVKIRNAGVAWQSNWLFVGNPLDELVNASDATAPYFIDISPTTPFTFFRDNTATFFNAGDPIDGDVDIVAKAHDKIGHATWELCPYEMGYEIRSDSLVFGPFLSFRFTGQLLWDQSQNVVFKDSWPCDSDGDYDQRNFYEILTNHDADTMLITPWGDPSGKWATGSIPNGTYKIKAWAKDRAGNTAYDSMNVTTANYYPITLNIATTDNHPDPRNYQVQIPLSGYSQEHDGPIVNLSNQPAGRYYINVSWPGYISSSEIYDVFSFTSLDITLSPAAYVNGDVDRSGAVSIADAVFLIQYIFASGPSPTPWSAGVYIDPTPAVSIADVVYLINYIFAGGPPPGGGR